jgi:pilus assembly protein Flp/PilA
MEKQMQIMRFLERFGHDEEGVTAIEYGLIAALVAVVIIGGATALGANLNAMFDFIAGKVSTAMGG